MRIKELLKGASRDLDNIAEQVSAIGANLKNSTLCIISSTLSSISNTVWQCYIDTLQSRSNGEEEE